MAVTHETGGRPRAARGTGLELRLERGAAFVALPGQALGAGLELLGLAMEVPEVRLPFDVAAGAAQFRHRLCELDRLDLRLTAEGLAALVGRLALAEAGIASLSLALRTGFAEATGALAGGAPFTFKATLLPAEHGVEVMIYEPRLYAPAPISAAELPARVAAAAAGLARLEGPALAADPVPGLLRRLLPARGWKVPRTAAVRLAVADLTPGALRVAWDRGGAAAAPADPDLLAAIEGARAFAEAEARLAAGDLAGARAVYRALGPAAAGHPFGAARLLALLAADPAAHAEALALADAVLARRPEFPAALLARAQVHAARGEPAPAAHALADLAAAGIRRGEEGSALAAAEACIALGPTADTDALSRAVDVALALRREHLPALRALRTLGELGDREALLRACRRLAAYAPDVGEKAAAHARLGLALLTADPAAARLHLDHALRLTPGDPAALADLARACEQAGDHVRAVRAHDRVRELKLERGDAAGAAVAALEISALWERAGQPDNALLRCREACALAPSADAEARAAALADRAGQREEALEHHRRVLELADPAYPPHLPGLLAARGALAGAAEGAGDAEAAAAHLTAALALAPGDAALLRRLERMQGQLGRAEARCATLDALAAVTADPLERLGVLAQAARLAPPAPALARWRALAALAEGAGELGLALRAEALEGLAAAAAAQGDGAAEREALEALASLSAPGGARAGALDRMAAALERASDLAAALQAAARAREEEPSAERLEAELRLARRAGDVGRAAALLAERARGCVARDPARAALALAERAELLADRDPAAALAAARDAAHLDLEQPEVLDRVAAVAARLDPATHAAALLARAALARRTGDPEAPARLAAAGHAALAAGKAEAAEAALRAAVNLGLDDREEAGLAWSALADLAAGRGDAAAEREALAAAAPLLPTGARPRAGLRLAALAQAAGDLAAARAAAEDARRLAPREVAAVEACRAAAEAQGDAAAIPALLAALAALDPARAGALQLDRARRLAALGRGEEADAAYAEALAALEPDAGLAAEHAAFRRAAAAPVGHRPWGAPLEAFAARSADPAAAAAALRDAAVIALDQGEPGAALRCARAALAAPDGLAQVGPLLAQLLYRQGAAVEALALLRRLLEAGLPGAEGAEAAALCRAAAELAEEAGDRALALDALGRLLGLEPHDVGAALRRFTLDPDRRRAVLALAEVAPATRSLRRRAEAWSRAAAAARRELADPALSDALFARARGAAGDHPAALARVEAARVAAVRADHDAASAARPAELLDALRDLAAARDAAGDGDGADEALRELAALAARHGLHAHAVQELAALEARRLAAGDRAGAARHALSAGLLLLEAAGDPEKAEAALRRAVELCPGDREAWSALEACARARGDAGQDALLDALRARAGWRREDVAARREAAQLLLSAGRGDEALPLLWEVARADPRDDGAAEALALLLADREEERAELFELRAGVAEGPARALCLREAARARAAAGDEEGARRLARAAYDADAADDVAFAGALRDAGGDVLRLDAVLAARAAAVPEEAARCHRLRAEALQGGGQPAAALAAFDAWLALTPDDPGAMAEVAQAHAAVHGPAAARALDLRVTAAADRGAAVPRAAEEPARWRLGLAALDEGRAEEALPHLARAVVLAPGHPSLARALAALAEAPRLSPGDAEAAVAAARARAEGAGGEAERDEALRLGARLAERAGDRGPEAASVLEALAVRLLASEPGPEADALAERALQALLRAGENARAGALVARLARLAQGPRRAAWLERLATAAEARGDRVAARAAREEALAADPGHAALREAHLADLEASGDLPGLVRALEAAEQAPGADAGALALRRASVLAALGDAAGAERALEAALVGGPPPGFGEAVHAASLALEARSDRAGMARLELLRARAAGAPEARAEALLAAAALLERCGDLDGARAAAEGARDADPDAPGPWRALARVSRLAGERVPAARALLAAAARSQGAPAAEAALEAARLLDGAGLADEAGRALEAAVAADPGAVEARRALADRARAAGDPSAAARHLAAIDPDALPAEERHGHQRLLARALTEARDPAAEAAWQAVFRRDAADAEAFDRLAAMARARGDAERWLGLAAEHEGALSSGNDVARRRDLRCERAALLTDLGRLEAAEGTWQAALALDPTHRRALRALRQLLLGRGDHAGAADTLAIEARVAGGALETAELLFDEARIHLDGLRDRARSAAVLDEAADRLLGVEGEQADHLRGQVDRLRQQLAAAAPPPLPPAPRPPPPEPGERRTLVIYPSAVPAAAERAAPPEPPPDPAPEPAATPAPEPVAAPAPAAAAAPEPATVAPISAPAAPPDQGPRPTLVDYPAPSVEAPPERAAPPPGPPPEPPSGSAHDPLAPVLARARERIAHPAALAVLAGTAETLAATATPARARRLALLARAASEIAAFAEDDPPPLDASAPLPVPAAARELAAHPLARSAVARLVALLAPWLERLFPADLARRGVGPEHRLGPGRGPELLALLEETQQALGARPCAGFLAPGGACGAVLENTQPTAVVLGAGMAGPIPEGPRRFLVARALALADLGGALVGKFAPNDVAMLCELACRFAGARPAAGLLPLDRARAFLDALDRVVPPPERTLAAELAPAAAAQLPTLDPRAFAFALKETAGRVALLHVGDVRAALDALLAAERRLQGLTPAAALEQLELADLAGFALSDAFVELRTEAEETA